MDTSVAPTALCKACASGLRTRGLSCGTSANPGCIGLYLRNSSARFGSHAYGNRGQQIACERQQETASAQPAHTSAYPLPRCKLRCFAAVQYSRGIPGSCEPPCLSSARRVHGETAILAVTRPGHTLLRQTGWEGMRVATTVSYDANAPERSAASLPGFVLAEERRLACQRKHPNRNMRMEKRRDPA